MKDRLNKVKNIFSERAFKRRNTDSDRPNTLQERAELDEKISAVEDLSSRIVGSAAEREVK